MNTYYDSEFNRYTTPQIERKIAKAAKGKLLDQQFDYGYNFCVKCKRNDCKPIRELKITKSRHKRILRDTINRWEDKLKNIKEV